jgi:hypothetical protein
MNGVEQSAPWLNELRDLTIAALRDIKAGDIVRCQVGGQLIAFRVVGFEPDGPLVCRRLGKETPGRPYDGRVTIDRDWVHDAINVPKPVSTAKMPKKWALPDAAGFKPGHPAYRGD